MDIENKLQQILSQLLFEDNNPITRGNIKRSIESYLSGLVVRKIIKSYTVQLSDDCNSSKILWADITITINTRIEKIHLTLSAK